MSAAAALVYVVDDDSDLAASVARLLHRDGHAAGPVVAAARLLHAYPRTVIAPLSPRAVARKAAID